MVMSNFCMRKLYNVRFLFGGAKYLQQIFACEMVKANNIESQKTSASKHFSLQIYSKKWLHSEIKS